MTNPTSNFGWQMPTSTDLVTDLPADFETFGQAVDTSLADLKGGTSGQVLSKASNTDLDFTWVAQDDSNAIQNAIVNAKGDLITATANDTPSIISVGANGETLVADSSTATGLKWAAPSSGSSNVAGKNAVLNSAFNVWQRGTSFALTGSGIYTTDRWYADGSGSGRTISRQTTGDTTNLPNIQYCTRIARDSGNTATNSVNFTQPFETVNSIPFAGKNVVLSFYARKGANFSQASSQITVQLKTGTGTDQNVRVSYTGEATPINSTATVTTTWTRFTYTGTVAATATELQPLFNVAWAGTAGAADYVEITGVQLEIAGSATDYSPNTSTYQAELAACQRYFERVSAASSSALLSGGYVQNSTVAWFTSPIVAKRTAPSLAFSGAGTPQIVYSGGSGVNCTMGTVNGFADRNSVSFYATAASAVLTSPNSAYLYANTGQVNIDANSEL